MRHLFLLGFFALTLLSSALLLFIVQPMVGKILLPWLGGTPAVWNTCMVFFQGLLLAGYGYAHFLSTRFDLKKQWWIHGIVLLVALLPLALLRFDAGKIAQFYAPPEESSPIIWLLVVLLFSAGLPFFAVAATAPLLQKWFSKTGHPDANDPYFLYGASNLGSMVALLAYPFLIEPNFGVNHQTLYWLFGFIGMSGLIMVSGALALANSAAMSLPTDNSQTIITAPPAKPDSPGFFDFTGWAILGMIPSSLMLGVTTHITTDIAAIPLLWILPLTIYLLSFILVFSRIPAWMTISIAFGLGCYFLYFFRGGIDVSEYMVDRDYLGLTQAICLYGVQTKFVVFFGFFLMLLGIWFASRSFMAQHTLMVLLLPLAILGGAFVGDIKDALNLTEIEVIFFHMFLLFVVSMVCHGELARTRPSPDHLTFFYLAMSTGGVLGGIFNTIIAPLLFNQIVEYPLIAVLACLMVPGLSFGFYQTRGLNHSVKALEYLTRGGIFVFGLIMGAYFMAIHYVDYQEGQRWLALRPEAIRDNWFVQRFVEKFPDKQNILYQERNFFGTFKITRFIDSQGATFHKFMHGTTNHGMQVFEPVARRRDTLTYFHHHGAIGQLFETMREKAKAKNRPLKVGIMGIGTGTLAAYMEPKWSLDLFEIDPAVVTVATKTVKGASGEDNRIFTFIPDAIDRGVDVQIELGDGRRKMSKVEDGKYDLIFMDAFTSDAVPVHLLTKEAFEMYKAKLQDDGIMVINIANRYLRFEGVLGNMAKELDLSGLIQNGYGIDDEHKYGTTWVVMAKSKEGLASLPTKKHVFETPRETWTEEWSNLPPENYSPAKVWSDDYSNLPGILR